MGYSNLEGKNFDLKVKLDNDSASKKSNFYNVLVLPKNKTYPSDSSRGIRMQLQHLEQPSCSEETMKIFGLLKQVGLSQNDFLIADHRSNSILKNKQFGVYNLEDENLTKKLKKISPYELEKAILEFGENIQNLYQACEAKVKGKIILFEADAFSLSLDGNPKIVIDPTKCKLWYLGKYENPIQKKQQILEKNKNGLQGFLKSILSNIGKNSNFDQKNHEAFVTFVEKLAENCNSNSLKNHGKRLEKYGEH